MVKEMKDDDILDYCLDKTDKFLGWSWFFMLPIFVLYAFCKLIKYFYREFINLKGLMEMTIL